MAQKNATKAKKKAKGSKAGKHLLMIFGLLASAVFLPSTLLLLVGMLPSIVAFFADRTSKKNKAITVGAMNLSGCTPFLLDLWLHDNDFEKSFLIITDPMAIIVMYSAAAVGYLIDWAMTGIVANVLYHRGVARQDAILREQEALVERWGPEITGRVALDSKGFPIAPEEAGSAPEAKKKS